MTRDQINKASADKFDKKEWQPLIDFFWNRYNLRYFNPIKELQNHPNTEVSNNCGFLIATIDCILIETIEQYYSGNDKSEGKNHDPFFLFFTRSKSFEQVIKEKGDAGRFAGLIRSGLIHQSKTHKASVINKRNSTPILDWINIAKKHEGFKLNRDKFHKAVRDEYEILIAKLALDENVDLRKKFKRKLLTILE